jgi:hypothetical protein
VVLGCGARHLLDDGRHVTKNCRVQQSYIKSNYITTKRKKERNDDDTY